MVILTSGSYQCSESLFSLNFPEISRSGLFCLFVTIIVCLFSLVGNTSQYSGLFPILHSKIIPGGDQGIIWGTGIKNLVSQSYVWKVPCPLHYLSGL